MQLEQVVFRSADPPRLVAFYRALFAGRIDVQEGSHTELIVGHGRLCISEGEAGGRGDRYRFRMGPAALARVRRRVEHLSVKVISDTPERLQLRDPEGRLIELLPKARPRPAEG